VIRLFTIGALALAGVVAWLVLRDGSPPDPRQGLERVRDEAGRVKRAVARERSPLPRSHCPEGLARCRSVAGRIVLVELVDPDGDGDLHVVVASGSVTLPGFTAVDVRPGLRPARDPKVGDRASAAGQVQTGSYGQSQIHAVEFHVRPR
jgi:hypothetical protein